MTQLKPTWVWATPLFVVVAATICFLSACATGSLSTGLPQTPVTNTPSLPETETPVLSPTPSPLPSATPVAIAGTSAVEYRLPLTVQHVTESSATLYFELDALSEGILLYSPLEAVESQRLLPLASDEVSHQVTLAGLTPGVTYQAVVGLAGGGQYQQPLFHGQVWAPVIFRTPAVDQAVLRVGVLGDSGFGDAATYELARQMSEHDLDFTIHTGDVVYQIGENADPAEAFALKWYLPLSPLLHSMPIYPVVGNHDVEAATYFDGLPFYYRAFPGFVDERLPPSSNQGQNQWYAFAYRDVQFLMLDTQTFYNEGGRAEQDQWLAERLADSAFAHTIVVCHIPPYSSGSLHQYDGVPVQSWVGLFKAARVPLVLSGHSHNYERLEQNGITYIVSGGGSSTLYNQGNPLPQSRVFAARTHFVLLEIHPDHIHLTALAVGGEVLDEAIIPLR